MSVPDNADQDGLMSSIKAIDELVEEAIQIYELDNEKTNLTDELYNSLRTITNYLGFSMAVATQLLNLSQDTRIILMPSLDLLIIKSNFKSEQNPQDRRHRRRDHQGHAGAGPRSPPRNPQDHAVHAAPAAPRHQQD